MAQDEFKLITISTCIIHLGVLHIYLVFAYTNKNRVFLGIHLYQHLKHQSSQALNHQSPRPNSNEHIDASNTASALIRSICCQKTQGENMAHYHTQLLPPEPLGAVVTIATNHNRRKIEWPTLTKTHNSSPMLPSPLSPLPTQYGAP